MITQITSERSYTIGYFKTGSKDSYGISVSVTSESKARTMREARELLERAIKDATELKARQDKDDDTM